MSAGEGAEETEREHEKLGLHGGRKAEPWRRAHSGCWRSCAGCGGSALVRSVCTVMLGEDVDVRTWV